MRKEAALFGDAGVVGPAGAEILGSGARRSGKVPGGAKPKEVNPPAPEPSEKRDRDAGVDDPADAHQSEHSDSD